MGDRSAVVSLTFFFTTFLWVLEIQTIVVLYLAGWWIDVTLTGWKALWGCYLADQPFQGRHWRGQHMLVQKKVFRDVFTVNLGADAGGLFLQICWPFTRWPLPKSLGQALLVPWREVTAERLSRRRRSYVQLRFQREPRVRVRLREAVAREIAAEAGAAWKGGEFLPGAAR
jgi:hypothetical protein